MPHTPAPAFAHTLGKRDSKIAIVGEAWGKDEEMAGVPFIGWSGQELTRILAEAGIDRQECFLTNVFAFKPENNNLETLCGTRKDVGKAYTLPAMKNRKYLLNEYLPELDRLREELSTIRPNLVVALGGCAAWALIGNGSISAVRGAITESTLIPGLKVLPAFHPAYILRQWSARPILVADFIKANKERHYPEIRRRTRQILLDPTIEEVEAWTEWALTSGQTLLAPDIETACGLITMIGFATDPEHAMVIPFRKNNGTNYWPDIPTERRAWRCVERLLMSLIDKVFQNGMYDLSWLWRLGFRFRRCTDDTMLLHHSLYPEMNKSLGFLGSLYLNEGAWKLLSPRHRKEKDSKADA